MVRSNKNIIKHRKTPNPKQRRLNIRQEPLRDTTPLPKPIVYEDIDNAFKLWVEEALDIVYENVKLPTFPLFSNQKFSEYLQSWEHVDENKNLILNFKTISRENNPHGGTLYGDTKNIPGERDYLIKRVFMTDKNDRGYFINYKKKQPYCIDLTYNIGIFTNKFDLINKFNEIINDKFKSINAYMLVKGHYIGMRLDNIQDHSEYSIDDRQYYSQLYTITVLSYIITEDSFSVEETPVLKFMGFEGEKSRKRVEIEEPPCHKEENRYYNKPCNLLINMGVCDEKLKFKLDTNLYITHEKLDNVRYIKWSVNDVEYNTLKEIHLKNGDEIRILKLIRLNVSNDVKIEYNGYIPDVIFDKQKDNVEFDADRIQFEDKNIIN